MTLINLTDADVFTPVIQSVADGDAASEANFKVGHQGNADRTAYLRARSLGAAASYTKDIPLVSLVTSDLGSKFEFTISGGPGSNAYGWEQVSVTAPAAYFPFDLPKGDGSAKLISCRIYFRPIGGGSTHTWPVGTQPSLSILRQPSDGSAIQTVSAAVFLAAGSAAAYENPQNILNTVGAGGHVISNGDRYFLVFGGELGANSLVGLVVTKAEYTMVPA